jgi:di- and tripeptidase
VHTFECCHGAVLSLVARGETMYAGCQDGYIKVWDLETKTLVREIIVQEVRIHSASIELGVIYSSILLGR